MTKAAIPVMLATALLLAGACSGRSSGVAPTPTAGLQELTITVGTPLPEQTPATSTPTMSAATQRDILGRFSIAVFPSNFGYRPYDWASGGSRVAFIGSDLALYVADAPDYTPQRLADGPASEPRWSPDGKLIAFVEQDEGIELVSTSSTGAGRPVRVSPTDDEWRGRIIQLYRWLDDRTIAYDAHCGSGCQYLFEMTVDRPSDGSPPTNVGTPRHLPLVRTCADCIAAALAFHYSPDGRFIVADGSGWPFVAWYDRATEEQWIVTFSGDPPGYHSALCREFTSWDSDSQGFSYREAPASTNCIAPPEIWTYWHVDPHTHIRKQLPPAPSR